MNIAVEFDGSEFRSLQHNGQALSARRISTDYLVVLGPESRLQQLKRRTQDFIECEQGLLFFGETAVELSELLELPLQSPLKDGKLRPDDPVSRQWLGAVIDQLIPRSGSGSSVCQLVASSENQACYDASQPSGLRFLSQLVKLRGYEPDLISPGLAMVLSECQASHFSGIGLNLGTSQVDVSIVHQTRELSHLTIPQGASQIDCLIAAQGGYLTILPDGRQALNLRQAQTWRRSVKSLNGIATPLTLELRNQIRELLTLVVHKLQQELLPGLAHKLMDHLPVVVGGELAKTPGVTAIFQQLLQETPLSAKLGEVRSVGDLEYSALKGGLLVGESVSHQIATSSSAA